MSSKAWKMDFDIKGIRKAKTQSVDRGLLLAGEHILGVSNDHVPHEEGTLERSGKVTVDGDKAALSYDTPYAVPQHEDMTLKHDSGRTAKYLENAMNSERKTALKIIAQAIKNGGLG